MNPQNNSKGHFAICASNVLETGGRGVRFVVTDKNEVWPAFAVRYHSGVAAYINRCAHLALELDWDHGHFFDLERHHLICAAHGASYEVDTGRCIDGPCNGIGLETLQVVEKGGAVYLKDRRYVIHHEVIKTHV